MKYVAVQWVNICLSGEKELKPISGRVKDIAEFVLTCIMEQVVRTKPQFLLSTSAGCRGGHL